MLFVLRALVSSSCDVNRRPAEHRAGFAQFRQILDPNRGMTFDPLTPIMEFLRAEVGYAYTHDSAAFDAARCPSPVRVVLQASAGRTSSESLDPASHAVGAAEPGSKR